MKKIVLFIMLACHAFGADVNAQCGAGYTNCSLNWDYLSFFPSAGLVPYTNLAQSQTQRFAFGTQKITMTHNYASGSALGTSTSHTGEAGTFGAGADVNFSGNGQITVTFQTGVQNIRFSLYDIDRLQVVNVGAAVGTNIAMATVSGSTFVIAGSGTNSATGTSNSTSVALTSTDAALNVTLTSAAPITTFTITVTNSVSSPEWYLSDIFACSQGAFDIDYFKVARPFTNQGSYVLMSKDSAVFYVDVNSGRARHLFTAFTGTNDINAMAYDPEKHYVYYIRDSTTQTATNRVLYRYHYDMDTMGIVMNDINAILPAFDVGVESGGAAFYDSCLYFGIDLGSSSTYKCIIWKIEFNSSNVPTVASQVFGIDGSGNDWGDFAVDRGMLINFDGQAGLENYHHQDLYNKNTFTTYSPTGTNIPKQTAVDWNSNIYSVGDTLGGSSPFKGVIIPYNGTGGLTTASLRKANYLGSEIRGQWRDGGEAFKPRVDYGDAPATFDPGPADPAVHEISNVLYLGFNSDNEWATRGQTVAANSDNFDDGMIIGSIVNPSAGSFFTQIRFLNNSGFTATVCAWVDFNNNGVFDAGEGQRQDTFSTSASPRTAYFNWSGVSTTLTNGQYTYVRFRISLTSVGMGVANATGFFGDGEVEDYRLAVTTYPLETNLISFNATKNNSGQPYLTWEVGNERSNAVYTLQRSADSKDWATIKEQKATGDKPHNQYDYTDPSAFKGVVYYRLKITEAGNHVYSQVRKLSNLTELNVSVNPNPASTIATVSLQANAAIEGGIHLFDASGRKVLKQCVEIVKGDNHFNVDVSTLQSGLYWMHVEQGGSISVHKLFIKK